MEDIKKLKLERRKEKTRKRKRVGEKKETKK